MIKNCGEEVNSVVEHDVLVGASYISLKDASPWINDRACINIQNQDDLCFLYACIVAKHYDDFKGRNLFRSHKSRVMKSLLRRYEYDLQDFPMQLESSQIAKYEGILGINISVWRVSNAYRRPIPFITSSRKQDGRHILLLYVEKDNHAHYVWVKDPSALIARHAGNNHQHRREVCMNCTMHFSGPNARENLRQHEVSCTAHVIKTALMTSCRKSSGIGTGFRSCP